MPTHKESRDLGVPTEPVPASGRRVAVGAVLEHGRECASLAYQRASISERCLVDFRIHREVPNVG